MGNCIFYPSIKIDKKTSNPSNCQVSHVKKYDFFTLNEINISKKISSISNFSSRFQPISNYSMITLAEVNKKYDIIKKNQNDRYVLVYYKNVKIHNKMVFLQDLFIKKQLKKGIFDIINSYQYLLKSLEILHINKIVHYNLNFNNIILKDEDIPIIRNFSRSFKFPLVNEERKHHIFQYYYPENYFYPLEVYIICFLNNSSNSLSIMNIETICDDFVKNSLGSLQIFSNEFLKIYKTNAIFSLKSYVNKPKEEIIDDIIDKYCYNWDNYSLSIIYLLLLKNTFGSVENDFISLFTQLLIKNIDIIPQNRLNVQDTQKQFYNLTEECDFEELLNSNRA